MKDGYEGLEELFHRALQLSAEQRELFLAEHCRGDTALRKRITDLLEADEMVSREFLERGSPLAAPRLEPGSSLGHYTILRRIGEGGMGTVYAAQQASPRRDVALKVIRPDRISATSLRRFRLEAELLGSLQHGGIAQVFEAGTATATLPDGEQFELPFIAMELVRGEPLKAFAEQRGLGPRERVELVARIADAVHHAHQRGVIHRDLKPANVLVTSAGSGDAEDSDAGQPKVLDFGVARFVGSVSRTLSLETRPGELFGTLSYMSPEQFESEGAEVDVRSDVYALGVLLYELLAGRTPFEFTDLSIPEAIRRAASGEIPPLRSLVPDLDGDLSVIATKALERDRARRYQSALELSTDLRAYLAGDPIEARRTSTVYLLRRRLRRHRAVLVVGALALVAVTLALLAAMEQARENRRLADRARAGLAFSDIERGRLLGMSGNRLGEKLIWSALLSDPSSPHARWALWEYYSRNRCLTARVMPPKSAAVVAFPPNGSWIAVAGAGNHARLLDAETLDSVASLPGAPRRTTSLAVGAGGGILAAGGEDGEIVLWDPATAQVLATASAHDSRVSSLDFSPDAAILASAGLDGAVRLWNARSLERLATLSEPDPTDEAWCVRFSPGGTRLASASNEIRLWQAPFQSPPRSLTLHERPVISLAFGSSGEELYSGSQDRTLIAWDLESGTPRARLEADNGTLRSILPTSEEDLVYVSGWWRTDLWDVGEERVLTSTPHFEPVPIGGSAITTNGERMILGSETDVMRVWDLSESHARIAFPRHEGRARGALAPSGDLLATGDAEGTLRLLDVPGRRELWHRTAHPGGVWAVAYAPDGRSLATVGADQVLRVWERESGDLLWSRPGVKAASSAACAFSPDASELAVCFADDSFHFLDADSGTELRALPGLAGEALSIAIPAAGEPIATIARGEGIELWSRDGKRLRGVRPKTQPWTACFSIDGSLLAVGTWGRTVEIYDTATLSLKLVLEGHDATVWTVQFHPTNPNLLLSGAGDGTVRLWDLSNQANVLSLEPKPEADVICAQFDAAGRTVAACGSFGSAMLWDLEYFDRHIAGNLELQLARLGQGMRPEELAPLRRWAQEVRQRRWPRW